MKKLIPNEEAFREQFLSGNIRALSKGITMLESANLEQQMWMHQFLQRIYDPHKRARKIGITGVPGAGKSTCMNVLGVRFCNEGERVAVLAIDPSSEEHSGSLLGDSVRMGALAQHPNSFIRATATRGTLGGVHAMTHSVILLCEQFGFTTIFIESVGVGQVETTVRKMVDVLLFLTLTGAGDEIQFMKKGILEAADLIAVNKVDGLNEQLGLVHTKELQLLFPTKHVCAMSVQDESSIQHVKETIENLEKQQRENLLFQQKQEEWLKQIIKAQWQSFYWRQFWGRGDTQAKWNAYSTHLQTGAYPYSILLNEDEQRFL